MPRRAASILAATLPLLAAALCVAAEKPAAPPEAADPAAVHAKAVAELTTKLADPSQEVRKRATLAYERLVFHASRPAAEPERAAAAKAAVDALGTDVPRPVVLALLGTLEYVSRDEAVPCLARLIGHADPLVRERARRALLANPSPKALEPLRAALAKAKEPAWQIGLVNALGARRDGAAVQAIIALAGSDDEGVRSSAVEALARIGDPAAVNAIATATEKAATVRAWNRSLVAYLELADRIAAAGDRETALQMYRPMLGAKGHIRIGAILGLGRAGGADELPALFQALADEDPRTRGAAKRALGLIPVKVVTQAITAKAKTASPQMKAALLDILAQRGDPSTLPAFLAAAADAETGVRTAAYTALGKLGSDAAMPVLLKALDAAKGQELAAAKQALTRIHSPAATQALIDALGTAPVRSREDIIGLLADRRAAQAVPAFLAAAAHENDSVRRAAFVALGMVADAKALPALVKLVVGADGDRARGFAEKAILAMCRRLDDPAVAAPPVLAALDSPAPARTALLRVLGRIGGPKALAAIRAARKDADPGTQDTAIRTLAAWQTAAALDDLLDVAKTSDSTTHQVLALRGYVRVAGLVRDRTTEQMVTVYEDAMAAARRPVDKKMVLAGIADIPSLGTLAMAERYLADEALSKEAALAIIKIASAVCGAYPKEATTSLNKAIAAGLDKPLAAQAKAVIAKTQKLKGYVTAWECAGPYGVDSGTGLDLIDKPFPPEKPDDTTATWKLMAPGGYPKHAEWPFAMNLVSHVGGDNRCAYMRTRIFSPETQKAVLELGHDDGLKLWLGGKVVYTAPEPNSLEPGEFKATVTLEKGWNPVLAKVTQGSIDWGLCLRVTKPDGTLPEGVRANPAGK